mgnify:CR=1 FL=1
MQPLLTDDQWLQYTRDGYLRLGRLLDDAALRALQDRIDAIMLGTADVDYDRMLMQLDSDTGEYGDAKPMTKGHKGARLDYRKIEQLEFDPVFLRYIQHPLFNEVCARTYGCHVPVGVFRSMFMNKPAGKGTKLPWHQDRWAHLDRDPLVTLWTALDPATKANGCVAVIPGTHKFGVLNPGHGSGFLTPEMAKELCPEDQAVYLELEPGEVVLLHNWLMHGSDRNHSQQSRRALSVCYLDARTVARGGGSFPVVFGEGALRPEALKPAAQGVA